MKTSTRTSLATGAAILMGIGIAAVSWYATKPPASEPTNERVSTVSNIAPALTSTGSTEVAIANAEPKSGRSAIDQRDENAPVAVASTRSVLRHNSMLEPSDEQLRLMAEKQQAYQQGGN